MFGAEKGKADRLDGKGLYIGIVQARFNESITNEVTELVAFRMQGKNALERIEELGADPE